MADVLDGTYTKDQLPGRWPLSVRSEKHLLYSQTLAMADTMFRGHLLRRWKRPTPVAYNTSSGLTTHVLHSLVREHPEVDMQTFEVRVQILLSWSLLEGPAAERKSGNCHVDLEAPVPKTLNGSDPSGMDTFALNEICSPFEVMCSQLNCGRKFKLTGLSTSHLRKHERGVYGLHGGLIRDVD